MGTGSHRVVAGRYALADAVGRGGMGVVWQAYDDRLHRKVAVKELLYPAGVTDDERDRLRSRTLREARAVAAVEHPNAVRVFDIVTHDDQPWIVMEYVDGETLTEIIRERGPLPPNEASRIGLSLLGALEAAHSSGVLHRDVKPSNVIVRADGHVSLTDFGIATVDSEPESAATTTGVLVGSPAYIAPERARGAEPTPAADIWSLGATLWTVIEGRPPFDGPTSAATVNAVVSEPTPACTRCPGPLAAVVERMLDKDPARRPAYDEIRRALETALDADRSTPADNGTQTAALPPAFDRTVAVDTREIAMPVGHPAPLAATPPAAAAPASEGPATPTANPTPGVEPTDGRRVRQVLTALVLVALAVGAGLFLAFSGGGGGPSTTPAPSHSTGHSPATRPSASTGSSTGAPVPAGYRRYTDPTLGWSVAVPKGWQATPASDGTQLRDPVSHAYLLVDTRYPAGSSAKGAWEDEERMFAASHAAYQRLRLENVDYRGLDAADWEFLYTDAGARLHALDRGMVVGDRGYGLFFQTHADDWSKDQSILRTIWRTFRPGR